MRKKISHYFTYKVQLCNESYFFCWKNEINILAFSNMKDEVVKGGE